MPSSDKDTKKTTSATTEASSRTQEKPSKDSSDESDAHRQEREKLQARRVLGYVDEPPTTKNRSKVQSERNERLNKEIWSAREQSQPAGVVDQPASGTAPRGAVGTT
jgi:hypothetical protein